MVFRRRHSVRMHLRLTQICIKIDGRISDIFAKPLQLSLQEMRIICDRVACGRKDKKKGERRRLYDIIMLLKETINKRFKAPVLMII